MSSDKLQLQIKLRDVKYDISQFDVHGASYRHMGSDPYLMVISNGQFIIKEAQAIHTAPFRITARRLNVIEAYGGLEDLVKADLQVEGSIQSPGRLIYPKARGIGGTALPILVPIARVRIQRAFASIQDYRGKAPICHTVEATNNSVEAFVDWEMTHKSHKLLFDTPGFHIGIQGNWQDSATQLPYTGVAIEFNDAAHNSIAQSLRLVVIFDQEFIKVALHRSLPSLATNFVTIARERYDEINGEQKFGHQFDIANFRDALEMIGERVQQQRGLQQYYKLV